jgi:hypothetical protein
MRDAAASSAAETAAVKQDISPMIGRPRLD